MNRTNRSVRQRYFKVLAAQKSKELRPGVNLGNNNYFTDSEDRRLLHKLKELAVDVDGRIREERIVWHEIAAHVGTRDKYACRQRWKKHLRNDFMCK